MTEAHVCEQLAQGRSLREAERPELEPATYWYYWLQVQCPNQYATTPHRLGRLQLTHAITFLDLMFEGHSFQKEG